MSHRSISRIRPFPQLEMGAFSLIELLAVITLLAVLATAAVPAVSGLNRSGSMNTSLIEISGLLSQARQYAVAQNTYVWVAFRSDPSNDNSLSIAVLGATGGQDTNPWADYGSVPNSSISLLAKPRTFNQMRMEEAGTFTDAKIKDLAGTTPVTLANSLADQTSKFSIRMPNSGREEVFYRAVQFTPDGQARVAAAPIDVVEFGLRPMRGDTPEANNVAVLRINGLTGKTTVYRP